MVIDTMFTIWLILIHWLRYSLKKRGQENMAAVILKNQVEVPAAH